MKQSYVYIMSNYNRTVLYTGVTNDLERRIREHKSGEGSEFTNRYNCVYLVYYERMQDVEQAIKREKQLKKWKRKWKDELINEQNPSLRDLSSDWND